MAYRTNCAPEQKEKKQTLSQVAIDKTVKSLYFYMFLLMVVVIADVELVYLSLLDAGINVKPMSYPLIAVAFIMVTSLLKRKIVDIFEPFTPLEDITIKTRSSVIVDLLYYTDTLIEKGEYSVRDRFPENDLDNEIIIKAKADSKFVKEFLNFQDKDGKEKWMTVPEGYILEELDEYTPYSFDNQINDKIRTINALIEHLDYIKDGYLKKRELDRKLNEKAP